MKTPDSASVPAGRPLALSKASTVLSIASWFGLTAAVLLAMPAVQASRSIGLGDRKTGAMELMLYLLPWLVFVVWISLLSFRRRNQSVIASGSAIAHGLATIVFTIWLVIELFY